MRNGPVTVVIPEFGLTAFTSRHGPQFEMAKTVADYQKVGFVHSGSGRLVRAGEERPLLRGSVVRIAPGTPHFFADGPKPMVLSMICFESSYFDDSDVAKAAWARLREILPADTAGQIPFERDQVRVADIFEPLIFEVGGRRELRDAAVLGHAVELLVLLCRGLTVSAAGPSGPKGRRFAESVDWLDDHYTRNVSIHTLAEIAGVSYRSYTAAFRDHFGMTVTQYVTKCRIDFAKSRLLQTGDIPGTAFEAGFNDLSHFYRKFRDSCGMTPKRFIRSRSDNGPRESERGSNGSVLSEA
ncbi:MAG: AraC family transcriptional regulator [Planctomycetota bacterium]